MNILVTGGGGFIGSHLAESLIRDGHRLSILDDFNDFYSPSAKRGNIEAVRRAGDFRLYEGDICDPQIVARIFEEENPEAITHLAARAGVRPSLEHRNRKKITSGTT